MPRTVRDVVFVDGVRTPFGKAGPKGIYHETRADDLVVKLDGQPLTGRLATVYPTIENGAIKFEASDPLINRLWIRIPADHDEHVWGGGEQMSYFDMRGRRFPLWTSEPGVGREHQVRQALDRLQQRATGVARAGRRSAKSGTRSTCLRSARRPAGGRGPCWARSQRAPPVHWRGNSRWRNCWNSGVSARAARNGSASGRGPTQPAIGFRRVGPAIELERLTRRPRP